MTKRRMVLLLVEEETDDAQPISSRSTDAEGAALDELSGIKPALAKATPGKLLPLLRKAGGK